MQKRDTPSGEPTVLRPSGPLPEPDSAAEDARPPEIKRPLRKSAIGSGLLAQQPTPHTGETVTVAKLCPQCGSEYETGDRFCPKDGSALRPKTAGDPLIGRVIADRYLILAQLGEGGMGRVYLAEHVKMTRQCAIKVMNPALMNDSESLARFGREASSSARILHPNVAAVFDYGEADGVVYLVMEYVDGEPLSRILIDDAPLDPRRAIDLARQIADGLSAAHELGIVHRDLKPDNVIISRTRGGKETAKIVDFGIAKALSDLPQDALTRSGLVIGTPEYMSPEQLLGDPVDARADIYSLGCILYQMLTGDQPFIAGSREQMIRRRLHETPPHVRAVLPDLPRRLDTLILHMLARASGDRLASAAEARDALDPSLALGGWDPGSIKSLISHESTAGPTIRESDPLLKATVPMPRQEERGGRNRRTNGKRIAVIVGVSALALAGVLTLTPRIEEQPDPVPAKSSAPTPADSAVRPNTAVSTVVDAPPAKPLPALSKLDSAGAAAAAAARAQKTAALPAASAGSTAAAPDSSWTIPLERFRAAAARGDVAGLAQAVPVISPAQKHGFEQVYGAGENFHSRSIIGNATITGDHAEVPLTIVVTYLDKAAKTPSSVRFEYRAVLARRAGHWDISELRAP